MFNKIRIKMADGEVLELDQVSGYSVNGEKKLVEVVINGYRQFFNLDYVFYIGRVVDIDNREQ